MHAGLFSINQMGGLASCFIDLYSLARTPSLLIMPMTCQKVKQPQGLCWDAGSNTYVNVRSEAAPRPRMTPPSPPTHQERFNCRLLKSQRCHNFTYLCLRHVRWQCSGGDLKDFAERVIFGRQQPGPYWLKWPAIDDQSTYSLRPRARWGKNTSAHCKIC